MVLCEQYRIGLFVCVVIYLLIYLFFLISYILFGIGFGLVHEIQKKKKKDGLNQPDIEENC